MPENITTETNSQAQEAVPSGGIAINVDEIGLLKIRSLIARYGLQEFLEAVFLEVYETLDYDKDDPDYVEARRVHRRLDNLIGWGKRAKA
jgi:hypothetical protein